MVEETHRDSNRMRFVAGVVRDKATAEDFAVRHDMVLATDLEALLSDGKIEAVVLATPHNMHVEQIIAAASAGKPVFSEKPLALTLAEARRAVDACAAAGVVLGLGTDRRMLPAMQRLRSVVEGGEIGRLLHVEGQYSNDNMRSGRSGSWRSDLAINPAGGMTGPGLHALDAMLSLAGTTKRVTGQLSKGVEPMVDAVSALYGFENGCTGLLGCVRGTPDYFRLAAFGDGGWAELRHFGELEIARSGQAPVTEHYPRSLAIVALLDAFAAAVEGEEPFPVTPLEMLETVAAFEATVDAMLRSSARDVARGAGQ
jgi:predicted dehydrogenase